MTEISQDIVEYRTACRLSDQLKLQFFCTLYAFRYVWIIFAILIVILLVTNSGPAVFLPLIFGIIGGLGAGPAIVLVRGMMGKLPKEIQADITAVGIKIMGEGFNYEAKWPGANWVREGRSAYLLKFKALLVRLPKRGFSPGQEAKFRQFVGQYAPAAANRLKP